jgi:Putative transposase
LVPWWDQYRVSNIRARLRPAIRGAILEEFGLPTRRRGKTQFQLRDDGQYAESSFAGPQVVLAYLSRYTHRVAISNRRLISADETGVTFKWKDYRIEGPDRDKTMTLPTHDFIRRFLTHVPPKGLHRIRHYGLLASAGCKANMARARELMAAPIPAVDRPAGTPPIRTPRPIIARHALAAAAA